MLAGVPGLEPRMTVPETVVLPITPYPTISLCCSGKTSTIFAATNNNYTGALLHHATSHLEMVVTKVCPKIYTQPLEPPNARHSGEGTQEMPSPDTYMLFKRQYKLTD